jgi:hypothetical protein
VISKAPVSLWYINMNNYEIMFVFIADMLEKNERKLREENDMLKRENIGAFDITLDFQFNICFFLEIV